MTMEAPVTADYEQHSPDVELTPSDEVDGIMKVESRRAPLTRFTAIMTPEQQKKLVTTMYMGVFAIFGALIRILVAQLFGEECRNPGTVGWLAGGSPLCVTAHGEAIVEGGIIFADLPANVMGSFIMGLFQTTAVLGLPVSVPIAFLKPNSFFQHWTIIHLAIRTGFCGSLTTFSSWNSEMVVIMFGSGANTASMIFRAFFGYVIGMETALGSFVLGKKFATWFHRWLNPLNGIEADVMLERQYQGVYMNSSLPEFERRFLPDLEMEDYAVIEDKERLDILARWRESTREARLVGHPHLQLLCDVENAVLVERVPIPYQIDTEARNLGWDCDALLDWSLGMPVKKDPVLENDHWLFVPEYAVGIFSLLMVGVIIGIIAIDGDDAYGITYRTMFYALLLAPAGALLRWSMGGMNGTMKDNWYWFPLGTFAANLFASMIGIAMNAMELVLPIDGFWTMATLRAVKIGFGGCLSTVSTFVMEVNSFMTDPMMQDKGYQYTAISLSVSCVVSCIIYAMIVWGLGSDLEFIEEDVQ